MTRFVFTLAGMITAEAKIKKWGESGEGANRARKKGKALIA